MKPAKEELLAIEKALLEEKATALPPRTDSRHLFRGRTASETKAIAASSNASLSILSTSICDESNS